jgi:CO/xanthine dehydrogenase FAD-binding subunit
MHETRAILAPADTEEAFALVASLDGRYAFLAGGVTLGWHRNRIPTLVSLARVVDGEVRVTESHVEVGAGLLLADAEGLAEIGFPALGALARACGAVGSPPLRNMATLGGNLISHFDFCDPLGSLYLLAPELDVASAAGAERRPFASFFTERGRFRLERGLIVTRLAFPRSTLARYVGAHFHKEARVGFDLGMMSLTVLARRDGACDIAVSGCFTNVQRLIGVRDRGDLGARLAALPRPKDDRRASAAYRQAILQPLLERGMRACECR